MGEDEGEVEEGGGCGGLGSAVCPQREHATEKKFDKMKKARPRGGGAWRKENYSEREPYPPAGDCAYTYTYAGASWRINAYVGPSCDCGARPLPHEAFFSVVDFAH